MMRCLLFLCALLLLTSAYAQNFPTEKRAELKAEFKLKVYDKAILHFQKGRNLFEQGKYDEAMKPLKRALQIVPDFPEAHKLLLTAYEKTGELKNVEKLRRTFPEMGRIEPLLARRTELAKEIEQRELLDTSPRVPRKWGLLGALLCVALLGGGLMVEYRRIRNRFSPGKSSIIVEPFAGDEVEMEMSPLFKLYLFLLPFPTFFVLLLALGMQKVYEVISFVLFLGAVTDLAIWTIFFSSLWDLFKFWE
jgi:tetratricopeptide (TPR) repeat protein